MIFNRSNIEAVFEGLKAEFNDAFDLAKVTYPKIATTINSSTGVEEYAWVDALPKMRKWVDERHIRKIGSHLYRLKNEDWETTIDLNRNDIEDDQLGMLKGRVRAAGMVARTWPDEMVYAAVNASFKSKGYDGVAFISKAHPLDGQPGSRTFSNQIDKPLSATSLTAAQAALGAAETALMKMEDHQGNKLGLMGGCLLVPPDLYTTATLLMESDVLGGDDPNPFKGRYEVVASPRLTDAKKWWLIAEASAGLLPFVWQERMTATIEIVNSLDDHYVFMTNKALLGVHGRGVAGYTLPQLVVGSTGTG